MPKWEIELEQLSAIGSLARDAANQPVDEDTHREGRDRIVGIAVTGQYHRRRRARALAVFALAAAFAAGGFLWLRPHPLHYQIVGGSNLQGTYVSAPAEAPVELQFSDGSGVRAEAGSRLRVDETFSDGARVLIEKGQASSHVTHRKRSNWTFVAGPFEVHVVGTRFDLNWDPLSEEFDLRLREGSVEVRSPLADGPIVVRAGQRFRATMVKRSMIVTDADSIGAAAGAAEPVAAAPDAEPAAGPSPALPASKQASSRRESWQDLLAHGEFESIVSAAGARGSEWCPANCGASDLRSLADAARYTGRTDLADKCLLALRKRFQGSTQSAAAAFLLGRTHESRAQSAAARWYETYLDESPDGEFAAEALAGKMRIIASTNGTAAAKPVAMEYLRRYPQGVHVKTARKIAGAD
jgi:hypothetical protein